MCGVKKMKLKTMLLATLLSLSVSFAVQAESVETYEEYHSVCKSISECNSLDVTDDNTDTESVSQQGGNNTVAQRTRRRRPISQFAKEYYIGAGGAIYFPDGGDTLFGGNIFGGIRFSPYVSADADFLLGFGDFTLIGLLAGPKFEIGITETSEAVAFISPGLGITIFDFDNGSDTEFSFQIKSGVTFPAGSNKAFAQGRYINADGDVFSLEGGIIF